MNVLKGIKHKLDTSLTNILSGPDFNRKAFAEAHRRPLKLRETKEEIHDDGNEEEEEEEEWSNLSRVKGGLRAHDQVDVGEEFCVKEGDLRLGGVLRQLKAKVPSERAVGNICEVAGVSREYAVFALGFVAKKMGCDFGWLANQAMALDAVMGVKEGYPRLEDVKEASREGADVLPDEEDEYFADREAEEERKKKEVMMEEE